MSPVARASKLLPRVLALALLATGCASGGLPAIIDASDVSSGGGTPRITRIRDAGTGLVPRTGSIEAITDGVSSPGELLVIEGHNFGRLPAVTLGGRPTEVLARTRGDGIVVRVPGGAEAGLVDVAVTTSGGTGKLATSVRRLAVVLTGERLRFVSVGRDGITALPGELPMPGGRAVRMDSTGGEALVLANSADVSRVAIVDLGRAEPTQLGTLALSHRGAAIAVAAHAPRVVIVGDGKLSVIDTTSLRRPVLFEAVALPKEVRGIRSAELSPDGRVLAILLGEGNRVMALDLTRPAAPQLISGVDILPTERQSLVRDLAFSPDGQTLWVVSGASADTYPQVIPTRITAVSLLAALADGTPSTDAAAAPAAGALGPVRRMLAVWKTQTVTGAGAPLSIYVGQAPEQSGSAIRTAPELATVYITAVKDALLDLKRGAIDVARLKKLMAPPNAGMIARAELSTAGGPIATTREILGTFVVPPGGVRALALALRGDDAGLELGVASVSLDGQARVQFTGLAKVQPSVVHPPFTLGDLAIQP